MSIEVAVTSVSHNGAFSCGANRDVIIAAHMKNFAMGFCCTAVWLMCACGANGVEDVTEVADAPDGVEAPSEEATLGVEQPNECGGSVERNLANLAGATAEEIGRWEVTRDFQLAPDGASLELSAEGAARCDDGCTLVNGILSLQRPEAAGADNAPAEFAAALVSGWGLQKEMEATSLGVEDHELTRIGTEPSQCGNMFWFEAERANCSGDCGVMAPDALRFKLLFAGYPNNSYLEFQSALDFEGQEKSVVGIDPTYGLNETPTTCAPTCSGACTKIFETPPSGCQLCCVCNNTYRTYTKATWSANVYLCM